MTGGILVKSQNLCIMQLSNIITWVMFNLKQSLGLMYTARYICDVKWGASSRWLSSLYCPMRNSDQMTIGKTRSTLVYTAQNLHILILFKLFGFRTIELVQDAITNGTSFYFRINEKPIFMSGSNWIPATNYYPETEQYYSRLLSAAQVCFK